MDTTTTPRIASKTVLARFESKSKPGTYHEVKLGADGVVYCGCPSWRFQKSHPSCRSCKHTKAFVAQVTHAGVPLALQGAVQLPKAVRAPRRSTRLSKTFWEKL